MFAEDCQCLLQTASVCRRLLVFSGYYWEFAGYCRCLPEIVGDCRRPSVFAGDCQCLPETVGVCQRLLVFAGDIQCLPETSRDCRCLLETSRVCWRLPVFAGDFPCLLETASLCWKLSKFIRDCPRLLLFLTHENKNLSNSYSFLRTLDIVYPVPSRSSLIQELHGFHFIPVFDIPNAFYVRKQLSPKVRCSNFNVQFTI